MIGIVCLGNPGKEYNGTRHNIGFEVADKLADVWQLGAASSAFSARVYQGRVHDERVYVLKPQTFMNLSGKSVQAFMQFYKLQPEQVIVVCDDFDLDFGVMRLRKQGSAGTHNGLKSIVEHVGSTQFGRLRAGIGPLPSHVSVSDFVLSKFSKQEFSQLPDFVNVMVEALEMLVQESLDKAASVFNGNCL